MSDSSTLFIVTDNFERIRDDLFGGTVPGWAFVITSIEGLQRLSPGCAAMAIWHGRRDTALVQAWFAARKRCPGMGLDAARMAGFHRWRAARQLAPHPAVFDLDCDASAIAGKVDGRIAGFAHAADGHAREYRLHG